MGKPPVPVRAGGDRVTGPPTARAVRGRRRPARRIRAPSSFLPQNPRTLSMTNKRWRHLAMLALTSGLVACSTSNSHFDIFNHNIWYFSPKKLNKLMKNGQNENCWAPRAEIVGKAGQQYNAKFRPFFQTSRITTPTEL